MNFAQTVDPYKVWTGFPGPQRPLQVVRMTQRRREVLDIIRACPGIRSAELRAKTGAKKRAMFALLQGMRHDGMIRRDGQQYYAEIERVTGRLE